MTPRYFLGALAVAASLLLAAPGWAVPEQPTQDKPTSTQAAKPARHKISPAQRKAAVKPKRLTVAKPVAPVVHVAPGLPMVTVPALTLTTALNSKPAAVPSMVPPVAAVVPAPAPAPVEAVAKPVPAVPEQPSGPALGKPPVVATNVKPAAKTPDKPASSAPNGKVYVGALTPPVLAYSQNPYLTAQQQVNDPIRELGVLIDGVKQGLAPAQPRQAATAKAKGEWEGFFGPFQLPVLPPLTLEDFSLLPKIKTVYPTGEKPLVILTFRCPTELIGITPLPTKALHDIVTWGMDGINSTNLLAFNMQQVCQ